MRAFINRISATVGVVGAVLLVTACSLANRDGPDTSCTALRYGAVNACQQGILAACVAGSVTYKACADSNACTASWQTPTAYRCAQTDNGPWGIGLGGPMPTGPTDGGTDSGRSDGGVFDVGSFDVGTSDTSGSDAGSLACGFAFKLPACATCVASNCCTVLLTCASDAECTSCVKRPASASPCVPGQVADFDAFTACVTGAGACATACGG
ncbi:MAG: hypothetical protein ACHREM_12870 [Polyangiales bacterium]